MYGTTGNSFVAVVEFGDQVKARAVTAGGQSGDPKSPHFNDQAARYATGDLREVYFLSPAGRCTQGAAVSPGRVIGNVVIG
jgi:acyl-homoserine lactone acylase PvdQ